MRKSFLLPFVLFPILVCGQVIPRPETVTGPLLPPDFSLTRASTIIHPDETKTVTLYDAEKRESDVTYWNADQSWRAHVVYHFDEANRIKFGQFINKNGKLGVRALYRYDDANRVFEEKHFNEKGVLVRRMTYEYGLTDRVMKTVAYDAQGNVIGAYTPKRIATARAKKK